MHRISGEISPQGASENLGTQQRTELRSAAGKFKKNQGLAAQRLPATRQLAGAGTARSAHPPQRSVADPLVEPGPRNIPAGMLTNRTPQGRRKGKEPRP